MRGGRVGLSCGLAIAVAFVGLGFLLVGRDASAALTAEPHASISPAAGTARATTTLAKAKKKKRGGGGGGGASSSKPDSDDAGSSDDDSAGKSSAASSGGASDDAKEEELLGSSTSKKAKKAAPRDDGDSSSGDGGGDKAAGKTGGGDVDSVSAKASSPEEPAAASTVSALEFGLGARALFRNFNWTADGRAAMLGPYALTPGPETGLWLEFYPAALGSSGFAANVGIFGSFNYGFGVATTLANGNNVPTTFRDYLAGLKVRIPFGTIIPSASVAYGQQLFEIAQQQNTLDLPQLAYSFVRPGLGTRVMFTPEVALDVNAAYLLVLDPGSGADHIRAARYFPKATAYGIDVSASIAYRLTGAVGVRAGADWRQYGLSMHPDSNTRAVAGAVDRYVVAWAGLEVVLDGQGGPAGGDDEPAKPSKRKRRHAESKSDDESGGDSSPKSEDE